MADNFAVLKPAMTIRVQIIGPVNVGKWPYLKTGHWTPSAAGCGRVSDAIADSFLRGYPSVVAMIRYTAVSHPDFPISINAFSFSQGKDNIRNDPDGKYIRLDARGLLKDLETDAPFMFQYKGVLAKTPTVGAILSRDPKAKTTEFGDALVHMSFETNDERLKGLKEGIFVATGRFVVDEKKSLTAEYNVSQVVMA